MRFKVKNKILTFQIHFVRKKFQKKKRMFGIKIISEEFSTRKAEKDPFLTFEMNSSNKIKYEHKR